MLKISTRFSVSVHILALLVVAKDRACSSEFIAGSVNTNAVVIRRLLGLLKRAGLVSTAPGVAGATLAKKPEQITLLDIYQAVGAADSTLFAMHEHPNLHCPVGSNIEFALDDTIKSTQSVLERELASRTLADIVARIETKLPK